MRRQVSSAPLTSQEEGKQFEAMFQRIAQLQGFWPRKMHLTARYTYNGNIQACKSELDYQLVHNNLDTAFIDCKSFSGNRFAYSHINADQLKLAYQLNEWGKCAGFVIWLRAENQVVFYSGKDIMAKGEGNSFGPDDGVLLGDLPNFRLSKIFSR